MDPTIKAHFFRRVGMNRERSETWGEGRLPMWGIPRQGDMVQLPSLMARLVVGVTIVYDKGMGDTLNPALVEVEVS